jgi:hypothetical protein
MRLFKYILEDIFVLYFWNDLFLFFFLYCLEYYVHWLSNCFEIINKRGGAVVFVLKNNIRIIE